MIYLHYLSIDFLLRRLILSVLLCRAFSAVVGVLSNRCRGFVLIVLRLLGKVMCVPGSFGSADAVLKPILRRFRVSPRGGLGVVLGGLWCSEGGLGRSWDLLGAGLSQLEAGSRLLRRALERQRVALPP